MNIQNVNILNMHAYNWNMKKWNIWILSVTRPDICYRIVYMYIFCLIWIIYIHTCIYIYIRTWYINTSIHMCIRIITTDIVILNILVSYQIYLNRKRWIKWILCSERISWIISIYIRWCEYMVITWRTWRAGKARNNIQDINQVPPLIGFPGCDAWMQLRLINRVPTNDR